MPVVADILQAYRDLGQAQAQSSLAQGRIWGGALQSIGEMAGKLPQEVAEQKRAALQQATGQFELDRAKQAAASQDRADQIIAQFPRNTDGTYDEGALLQQLSGVPLDQRDRLLKAVQGINGVITGSMKAKQDHLADAADVLLNYHDQGEPVTWDTVYLGLAALRGTPAISDADEQSIVKLAAAGGDAEQALKAVRNSGSKYQAAQAKLQEPYNLPAGDKRMVGATEIANNPPKPPAATRASIALEAAGGDAAKALESLKGTSAAPNVGSFDDYVTRKYGANPTPEQVIQARKDYGTADDRAPAAATVVVQTIDENGKPITKIVPKTAGASYPKAPSGATETRLASAEAVTQTGNEIVQKLKDPKFASVVGPLMGRFNSVRDWIGNPPPELSELAGLVESYALANMGVHGMRSSAGAEQIKRLLDAKHTPQSLASAIQGLQRFSENFMKNQGRTLPPTADQSPAGPAPSGAPSYQDYLRSRQK